MSLILLFCIMQDGQRKMTGKVQFGQKKTVATEIVDEIVRKEVSLNKSH